MEVHKLASVLKKVLWKIFEPKKEEGGQQTWILHDEKLSDIFR
jgi:hypothetical protein